MAEIRQKIRTNLEHFEAEKCKHTHTHTKKKNYISSKHVTKEWLESHQSYLEDKKH